MAANAELATPGGLGDPGQAGRGPVSEQRGETIPYHPLEAPGAKADLGEDGCRVVKVGGKLIGWSPSACRGVKEPRASAGAWGSRLTGVYGVTDADEILDEAASLAVTRRILSPKQRQRLPDQPVTRIDGRVEDHVLEGVYPGRGVFAADQGRHSREVFAGRRSAHAGIRWRTGIARSFMASEEMVQTVCSLYVLIRPQSQEEWPSAARESFSEAGRLRMSTSPSRPAL